jgi:hypothetical protein
MFVASASAQNARTGRSEPSPTTLVINVWPGVAPGSEQWKQKGTVLLNGMESVVNVSTPMLTAYLPNPSIATGTAVIIAPGGGFVGLSINSEGHEVAKWLVARGFAAIVLKYRTVQLKGQDDELLRQSAGALRGTASRPRLDRRGR